MLRGHRYRLITFRRYLLFTISVKNLNGNSTHDSTYCRVEKYVKCFVEMLSRRDVLKIINLYYSLFPSFPNHYMVLVWTNFFCSLLLSCYRPNPIVSNLVGTKTFVPMGCVRVHFLGNKLLLTSLLSIILA